MSKKPIKNSKLVSLNGLAELFKGLHGYSSRNSIAAAIERGMPVVSQPDENGGEWQLSVADVVNWMIDTRVREAVEATVVLGEDDNEDPRTMSEDVAKRRKMAWDSQRSKADALLKEIELMKASGEVIEIGKVAAILSSQLQPIRSELLNLDTRIAAKIPDPDQRVAVAKFVREQVNISLKKLTVEEEFADG